MTKDEIAAILREARIDAGLTQKEAAQKIGRKQQTLASWETGQSQPDANTLFVLCSLYGTTVDEAFGFGAGGNKITKKEIEHIKKYRNLDEGGKKIIDIILDVEQSRCERITQMEDKMIQIDLFDLPASAGFGLPLEGDYRTIIEVPDTPLNRKANFCIRVAGDSMEPDYSDGDIVLVKKSEVYIGDVGIFVLDGESYIKELGKDVLISRNPKYNDIPLPDYDRIMVAGKVIGKL